jgi:hypothetical protein
MLPFFLLQQTCTSRLVGGLVLRIFIDRNFRKFAETGAKGYHRFFSLPEKFAVTVKFWMNL